MTTVSLCMIVKNEEHNLKECLESVSGLMDEIIIVDTGSTDCTKEIAARYTDKIFDFQWINDFAAARNFSFSKATKDYIMWLDADDCLLEEDRTGFKELKSSLDPAVDVVMLPYHAGFDGKGNLTLSYYRERLLKREKGFQWKDPVHECIEPSGFIVHGDVHITHHKQEQGVSRRNLEIYQHYLNEGKKLSPRSLIYYALELYYHGCYDEASLKLMEFIENGEGWVEDNIKACYYLGKSFSFLNKPDRAMQAFLKSFEYDLPRAEHCCEIAYLYKSKHDYQRAIFWFSQALTLKKPENNWGFLFHDYWGYIPAIELSVCYYRVGNLKEAVTLNEQAGTYKPDDPAVIYNRQFYKTLNSQS